MRNHRSHASFPPIAALLAVTLTLGLAACGGYGVSHEDAPGRDPASPSTSESTGTSRAKLYGSVDELAADSAAVLVGRVDATDVTRDVDGATDFTLATVTVLKAVKGSADADGTVTVRQTGSAAQRTPETLLRTGDVALLFLAESGLPGDQAGQYYITGAGAGLYEAADDYAAALRSVAPGEAEQAVDAATFNRVDTDSGDTLPATLRIGDLD